MNETKKIATQSEVVGAVISAVESLYDEWDVVVRVEGITPVIEMLKGVQKGIEDGKGH